TFYSAVTLSKHLSFPTRRSSDLEKTRALIPRRTPRMCFIEHNGSAVETASIQLGERAIRVGGCHFDKCKTVSQHRYGQDSTNLRSEEHTSELQSLRHLVCRLLLE